MICNIRYILVYIADKCGWLNFVDRDLVHLFLLSGGDPQLAASIPQKQVGERRPPSQHANGKLKVTPAQPKRSPQSQPPQLESDRRADYTRPGYVLVGGIVGGNAIGINQGDSNTTSGTIAKTIAQLPDSPSEQPGIKELLVQLQNAIAAETTLPKAVKERALSQVVAIAEAARTPEDEESKSRVRGAMETLEMMGTLLPPETPLVAILNALETAIA